jgi:hypothetical protein
MYMVYEAIGSRPERWAAWGGWVKVDRWAMVTGVTKQPDYNLKRQDRQRRTPRNLEETL